LQGLTEEFRRKKHLLHKSRLTRFPMGTLNVFGVFCICSTQEIVPGDWFVNIPIKYFWKYRAQPNLN
jgi:hypothetical protein